MPTPEGGGDEDLIALVNQERAAVAISAPVEPVNSGNAALLAFLKKLTGNDLLCIFGDTGSGKSKLVSELAITDAKNGKRVLYWDTEQGFGPTVIQKMKSAGVDYRRTSVIRDIYQSIRNWHADLVIIDSATLFITGRWFAEQLDAKGRLLQELQYLYYFVKDWCHRSGGMAIIVAQPISEFGGRGLDVMGDKANFYLKDALYIDFEKETFTVKKRLLRVFKSRTIPEGTVLCQLRTNATGVEAGVINPDALRDVGGI